MSVKEIGAFIDGLRSSNRLGKIRDTIQGVEVEILNGNFGKKTERSFRIFPEATIVNVGGEFILTSR